METEITEKPPVMKNGYIALIIFILAFLIYYMVMAILSPVRKLKDLNEEYGFKQDEKNTIDERIFTDSAYLKLLKDKSFLQSVTAMAETDSVYLAMYLADSIADLEISGVTVHSAKIQRMNLSRILKNGNEYVISSMMSRPFTVVKNFSSIPKEPLMIKMAPKDTSEYKPDIIPDTADYEPVNYVMETDNGTAIFVYQYEKLNPGDGLRRFFFDLGYRMRSSWNSLKRIVVFKVPEYHPFIKIRLPRADAKIIYRALPEHGQIAVSR